MNSTPPTGFAAYVDIYGACSRAAGCACAACSHPTSRRSRRERGGRVGVLRAQLCLAERVIDQGIADGRLPATLSPHATAQSLVAGLEGAMLVSRPSAETGRFEAIADALLASMGVPPQR